MLEAQRKKKRKTERKKEQMIKNKGKDRNKDPPQNVFLCPHSATVSRN